MTDTQLTVILAALAPIATQFFLRWQTEQTLKKQALDIQEQAQANAAQLARKTEAAAHQAVQAVKDSHDSLLAAQTENTRLTLVGNDIKTDILKNQEAIGKSQEAIADTQKDVSALKNQINGNS